MPPFKAINTNPSAGILNPINIEVFGFGESLPQPGTDARQVTPGQGNMYLQGSRPTEGFIILAARERKPANREKLTGGHLTWITAAWLRPSWLYPIFFTHISLLMLTISVDDYLFIETQVSQGVNWANTLKWITKVTPHMTLPTLFSNSIWYNDVWGPCTFSLK